MIPLSGQVLEDYEYLTEVIELDNNCYSEKVKLKDVSIICTNDVIWGITNQHIYSCNGDNTNVLVKSIDGGKTWTDMTTYLREIRIDEKLSEDMKEDLIAPLNRDDLKTNAIYTFNEKIFIAIGGYDYWNSNYIIFSSDNGKTWEMLFPPTTRNFHMVCGQAYISFIKQNNTFIGNNGSRVLKWNNNEVEWIIIEDVITGKDREKEFITFKRTSSSSKLKEVGREYYDSWSGIHYISTDYGKTWSEDYRDKRTIRPQDGGFLIHDRTVISFDGGISWQKKEYDLHGITFVSRNNSHPCSCNSNSEEEKLQYGTTIITHGFQLDGDFPPGYKTWIDKLSLEILELAGEGCIYKYDRELKKFVKKIEVGRKDHGENILLYDWAVNSNNPSKGFSEAAADELFSALLVGNRKGQFSLDSLHFIGHSRGTVVNSLTVERLLVLKTEYPHIFSKKDDARHVYIDQVTNLSPHDWGIGLSWDDFVPFESDYISTSNYGYVLSDLDDAHPDIIVPFPNNYFPNNGTISWQGIFSDTYWQKNGKIEPLADGEKNHPMVDYIALALSAIKNPWFAIPGELLNFINHHFKILPLNLNDRSVWNTQNYQWDDDINGHSTSHFGSTGIHNLYVRTVDELPSFEDGGYFLSRLAGGENKRKQSSFGYATPTFNFYEKLVLNNERGKVERIRGVSNGSFDRGLFDNIPGWEITKSIGFLDNQSYVNLLPNILDETVGIRHNPLYLPPDAKYLKFQMKARNVKYGSLIVILKSLQNNDFQSFSFPIDADIVSFVKRELFVPENFRDKVVTIEFIFTGKSYDLNKGLLPTFQLDEVSMAK